MLTPDGIRLEPSAEKSGIIYRWPQQPRPMRNLEAFGTGCAFLDYDNDGWQDILLVGQNHIALFHNRGDGHFDEVTPAVGLDHLKQYSEPGGFPNLGNYWTGCAVGDYDGDGYLDIVLTGYHRLALLRNIGGKRFEEVTEQAGLDPQNRRHWGSSAGFMDLDGSGKLDLVICNYVIFNPKEKQYCELSPGVKSGCPPDAYRPEFPELWQNLGGGRFKDITAASGLKNSNGKALVVAFADLYGDGKMDFYIGNDGTFAELFHNLGNLHFENQGKSSGLAYGQMSHPIAAMGADFGDYDRDGKMDLTVTAFSNETYSLHHNLGKGSFENTSHDVNLSGPTLNSLGFGAKWIDIDNDGWPDMLFANGHVYDNVQQIDPTTTFRQPLMLFHNEKGKEFNDIIPIIGGAIAQPILGRGLATGDFDNDGRMDFLAVDYEGTPLLVHNMSQTPNHWVKFDLRSNGLNRFAYGAQITAQSEGHNWAGQVSPASSYLSSSDPRVHFGLGTSDHLEKVTIRWPDGKKEILTHIAAGHIYQVTEGKGITGEGPKPR